MEMSRIRRVRSMLGRIVGKVLWVGRTAATVFGLALVMALVFGLATTAIGTTGGNFILGKANGASTVSKLTASVAGPALTLVNQSTDNASTALNINVAPGKAPMKVNAAAGTATQLSADELDGKDSSDFYAQDSKVADSATADQADYATSAGSAADADTLDGLDSTDFQAGNPCPEDTMFHEGVCIEKIGRGGSGSATFLNAQSFCLNDERRLPTVAELQTFRNRQGHDFTGTEYTSQIWTDTDDTGQHQMVMLVGQAGTQSAVRTAEAAAAFRCVASPSPATPDSTTLESIAQADLRNAATAATACGADNNGSYANCGSIAHLAAYGYNQNPDVSITITATAARWTATTQHDEGGSAYRYDTETGRIETVARF